MVAKSSFDLDTYVTETLMRDLVGHDRRPSAFLVYLAIASGDGARGLSYGDLAEMTGLSRRSAQDAVAHLVRRKLIEVYRAGATETAQYRALKPWRR
jgi:CRP-like cAMP-binding protein